MATPWGGKTNKEGGPRKFEIFRTLNRIQKEGYKLAIGPVRLADHYRQCHTPYRPQNKKVNGSAHFAMLSAAPKTVSFTTQERQWDARFNVQSDEDLDLILESIGAEWNAGKFRYVLIGGTEIGTRPYQDDYQVRHIHVAVIFHNRVTKSSILKNWNIKQGNGYYLVPRNRDLPYSGWRDHHIKAFSKTDPSSPILYEKGDLPADEKKNKSAPSEEEKKRKVDDILIDMRGMIDEGQEQEAFKKYPRNYLIYGERIKAMLNQKKDFFKNNGDPHMWVYGYPGTGKSAVLNFIYPKYFKKNLHNKFFDLYDPKEHTHVMLEDLDHEAVEKLTINFIKTICDEAGFAVDQKYKTPQLARTCVLVTSNFQISEIMPDQPGAEQNKAALYRRFWHVNIYNLLRLLGLKLIPKTERMDLKKAGNNDCSKLFLTWDYVTDLPRCEPLKEPSYYQQVIKDSYYK